MGQLVYNMGDNMGDLEGIQTIRKTRAKMEWKSQVRDTMQTWEKQQELRKVGRQRPALGRGRCSGKMRHLNLGKPSSWAVILNSSLSSHHKERAQRHLLKMPAMTISWENWPHTHWKALEKMSKHFLKSHNIMFIPSVSKAEPRWWRNESFKKRKVLNFVISDGLHGWEFK